MDPAAVARVRSRRGTLVRLAISLPVAAGAFALVFRGVDRQGLVAAFVEVRPFPLALAVAAMALVMAARLARWGVIVRALAPVPAASLVRIGSIGTMAIDLLPVRLGELLRPALLQRWEGVPFGAGVASVVVERLIDLGALLGLLVAAAAAADLPAVPVPGLGRTVNLAVEGRIAILSMAALLGAPALAVAASGQRGLALLSTAARPLPAFVSRPLLAHARSFVEGVRRFGKPAAIALAAAFTAALWALNTVVTLALMRAFAVDHLGIAEAAVVVLVVAICLMLPAPAGGLGVFEAGGAAGLLMYGASPSRAAAFAIALHATHVGVICLFGLASLAAGRSGLRDVLRATARPAEDPACPARGE